jgi:hypothetical protein
LGCKKALEGSGKRRRSNAPPTNVPIPAMTLNASGSWRDGIGIVGVTLRLETSTL